MASVVLKTTADLSLNVGGNPLTLRGFGVINTIENHVWAEAKKHPALKDMLDKGFILESALKTSEQENAKADTMQAVKSKQDKQKPKSVKVEK